MGQFSEYIVFVDESGDHGLKTIDQNYPVFVLAFCIFRKVDYADGLVPTFKHFKFKHFGHDQVILHETDIRKDRGDFSILKTREKKEAFLNELTDIVAATQFAFIASVIRKEPLREKYTNPENPYHLALGFGLERIFYYLRGVGATEQKTHIVVEKRGSQEDSELELEFRRVCDGQNRHRCALPFEVVFADKKSNSAGLQMADLIARPIGMRILRPEQPNRAYDTIENKFYRNGRGRFDGWGLKCFP
ncbi:DUF3800 domain-containing protein [Desulfuromonas acetoxidans]|uniref:3-deoxy-D-manno-octulosonic-acid transferase n=1 Tax=Desulfuromonas acetoxidans (strain DSM 684 / 11070) TaxID=281689 RepID=Q1K1N1_DESA6|nr:DUF3800 domain-containing protein [Desulfuromonas acetoxidans]EAT16357.1 conserved hypothetical protein [Desulfuromonas acetoxidans DSM 684]